MLLKRQRLNLKRNFSWVVSGKKIDAASLKIFTRLGKNSTPRVSVTCSKKIFGNAPAVNKVRRRVYMALKEIYPQLHKQLNLVIMPKKEAENKNLNELILEIKEAIL